MTELADRILDILRGCPYGLTARAIAERLDLTARNISSRLSKLAAYGIIKKTQGRIAHNVPACAIYKIPTSAPSTKARFMAQERPTSESNPFKSVTRNSEP